jgi:hypothetical protein
MDRGRWFTDPAFEFAARTAVGHAAAGNLDIGPVLAVFDRIADGVPQSWYEQWFALGEHCTASAERAEKSGNGRTAGWFWLGASESFDNAIAFADGLEDPEEVIATTFARQQDAFECFADAAGGFHVRVEIPYRDGVLPGYLLRPDASGLPRATVIVTNGSDGSLASLWATIAHAALDRDLNVVVFDGPGQQRMLFQRGVPDAVAARSLRAGGQRRP